MKNLVNRFFGWKIDVLDNIRSVDERRVYKAGVWMRIGRREADL